jgi:hypothetical protein
MESQELSAFFMRTIYEEDFRQVNFTSPSPAVSPISKAIKSPGEERLAGGRGKFLCPAPVREIGGRSATGGREPVLSSANDRGEYFFSMALDAAVLGGIAKGSGRFWR